MDLMRKLRDEGKFKNSMLAEIERDEMMEKMKEQVDEIQADLEVRTSYIKNLNLISLFRRKSLMFSKKPNAKACPWTRSSRKSEMIGWIQVAWTITCKFRLFTVLHYHLLQVKYLYMWHESP